MEEIIKVSVYEKFLISKDNIILEINKDFLDLTGYNEKELLGKTLIEVGKILRIDSQISLEDIENHTRVFIFTKELVAIEGSISCKPIDSGIQMFTFNMDSFNLLNEKFDLANSLGTSRGDGVAIYSFASLVLINSNQNYIDFLDPPYNKKSNSIGKSIKEISNIYLSKQYNKIKDHLTNTRKPYHIEEIESYSKSLGRTYWKMTIIPILEGDIIKYIILCVSNITEEVLNREALKQRNQDLETIIKNMSEEIIIFDKDYRVNVYNKETNKKAIMDNMSLSHINDINGMKKYVCAFNKKNSILDEDGQLIHYEDYPFQRVARGEFISDFFIKVVKESKTSYAEVLGYPIYDDDGNFNHGIMIYRDIDHRMEKEEYRLIKAQNELLSKIVESLNLEYIRCTYPDLDIISINNNSLESFKKRNNGNKSMVSPIGESYFTIYPVDEEIKRRELEFRLIKKGDNSYIDYINHIVDGEERFFKTINQPIFGLNNKIVEIIFITIDITDEVKEKNKLQETLDMQAQVFTSISHELKTPLNVIFSAAQLIEMSFKKETSNIKKEDLKKNISIIKQNCHRFTKIINNIMDLSSMESGFYKLDFSNRNIVEIIENIVDSVRNYVEDTGLHIIFDTDTEEKIMAVDIEKMERIILNLISNAIKFTPKGENIYIEIKDKGNFLLILVSDCGVGISEEDLATIFNRYKKVDNSLIRNTEGSGIGLTLVKTMVKIIGGEISVESELGKGSLFTVKLPVKILDQPKVTNTIINSDQRIEQLNIEFSDIYTI